MNFFEKIFSIKNITENKDVYKCISLLGLNLKFKNEKKTLAYALKNLFSKTNKKQDGQFKIDIIGFLEDSNIGDPVIVDCCEWLVKDICKKNNINACVNKYPLFPPPNFKSYKITRFLRKRTSKNFNFMHKLFTFLKFKLSLLNKKNVLMTYYNTILDNSNLVIFAGGGMLKYYSQEFWAADFCIIDYCHNHNIPVVFNAVGIEGYDDNNFYSKIIRNIMNDKCIKSITTRDDVDSLLRFRPDYKNKEDLIVGDPALWSKEAYAEHSSKENIVGLNVIRSGIFNVNDYNTTEDDVINFYLEMIKRLDKENISWQLFTNGAIADQKLAKKILLQLGENENSAKLAKRPKTSKELIAVISKYKGVIAGRMHADIISTSFDIPVVGIIWNKKIKWFSKHLGCEERFFDATLICDYDIIFKAFIKALNDGNGILNTQKLKEKEYKSLEEILTNFKEKV